MPNPIIRIHNQETNEIVDREMTDAEFNEYQQQQTKLEEKLKLRKEAEDKRQILLEKLGITEEEAKLLLA